MIELILVVMAWKKGWKGYALLPLGFAVAAALVLRGMDVPVMAALLADLLSIIILIVMIKLPPQKRDPLTAKQNLGPKEIL